MARPLKPWRMKVNKHNLQVYRRGVYVGSMSFTKLYHILCATGTRGVVAHDISPEKVTPFDGKEGGR